MLAALYLLVTSLAGFAVATRAVPTAPLIVRAPAGFLLAVVFTSWTTYVIAAGLSGATTEGLRIGLVVSTVLGALVLWRYGRTLRPRDLRIPLVDAAVALFSLALSSWLMRARLREEDGELVVAANTWADTGLHVGLSRSFSVGANYPPEYPFFAGEPIRYHFGFDFFAGMLQEGGMSVLWSFNLPGVIGLTAMMVITFALARLLFSSAKAPRWWRDQGVWAGFVAVALLVTNQSLAWLRYVEEDGQGSVLTALRPSVWWNHEKYLAVGPYTDDRIAIFNTLNPFLGQTHLIIAVALVTLLAYVVIWQLLTGGDGLDKRLLVGVAVTFGAAFWLNGVVWLATAIFIGALLVIWALTACRRAYRAAAEGERWPAARAQGVSWLKIGACFAVPALALGVPQAVMLSGGSSEGGFSLHFGYLVCSSTVSSCHGSDMNPLSLQDWWSFVEYWWLNEGVFIVLLVVAFFIGSRRDKKIIAAMMSMFIWGSLVNVGADVGGHNHKVFNLWENLSGVFVAFALVQIWIAGGRLLRHGATGRKALGVFTRFAAVVLAWFLVVSGLVDFMTVKNDTPYGVFGDEIRRETTDWIASETPPRSTFLTDYDQLYTAATMAGRRVVLGYSPWAKTSGYDVEPRKTAIAAIYAAPDQATACSLLAAAEVDYVMLSQQERDSERFEVNEAVFASMTPARVFGTAPNEYRIYRVADNC